MKKTVCIIDDDDDVRDVLTFALENEGFVVVAFGNPLMAIDSLISLPLKDLPGFIMVDYRMPEMDGVAFVSKIMNEHKETLGQIPLAICSAENDLGHSDFFPKNVLHMNKPLELENLVETVRGFCE